MRHSSGRSVSADNQYSVWGTLKTRDWKSQDWKTWDQIAGVEKAGLENKGPNFQGWKSRDWNAGTSCAWVAKCNIINVRGHVRANVTAGRGTRVHCRRQLKAATETYEIQLCQSQP